MTTNGTTHYSVPEEAKLLLETGIISNPLVAKYLPAGSLEASRKVSFEGNDTPSIPINWRFAESISSLKGLEATVLNVFLQKKYGIEPVKININTYETGSPPPPLPMWSPFFFFEFTSSSSFPSLTGNKTTKGTMPLFSSCLP